MLLNLKVFDTLELSVNITPNPLISQSVKTILPNNVQSNGTSVVVVVVDEVELLLLLLYVGINSPTIKSKSLQQPLIPE
jgi:hypothetical protein